MLRTDLTISTASPEVRAAPLMQLLTRQRERANRRPLEHLLRRVKDHWVQTTPSYLAPAFRQPQLGEKCYVRYTVSQWNGVSMKDQPRVSGWPWV